MCNVSMARFVPRIILLNFMFLQSRVWRHSLPAEIRGSRTCPLPAFRTCSTTGCRLNLRTPAPYEKYANRTRKRNSRRGLYRGPMTTWGQLYHLQHYYRLNLADAQSTMSLKQSLRACASKEIPKCY